MVLGGLIIGTVFGLLASVLGYLLWSLPLWMAIALYPLVGTLVTIIALALVVLREIRTAPDTDTPARADFSPVR